MTTLDGGGLRRRRLPDPKLPRGTVNDTALSFRALGVLLWLTSRPDGWVVRSEQMANDGRRPDGTNAAGRRHRREGRDAIRTVLMQELAEGGYYRLERRRMRNGQTVMGTAVSEEPVESWAAQFRLFGRNAVPLVQQADGSFLVQYPDGTLGPDDCDAPPQVYRGDAEPDDEPAGQTGAGFPGPGNCASPDDAGEPGPEKPAPEKPEPGFPEPGNPAPLEREEVKGVIKEPPSPPSGNDNVRDPSPPETRGGDSSKNPNPSLTEMVGWFARRRSDWTRESIEQALNTAADKGMGTLPECAAALRELADGLHGRTDSPHRLHSYASGPWWASVQAKRAAVAAAQLAKAPRCRKAGHERQPADFCSLCAAEAKGRPDEEPTSPKALEGEKRFLPKQVRQRRAATEQAAS